VFVTKPNRRGRWAAAPAPRPGRTWRD